MKINKRVAAFMLAAAIAGGSLTPVTAQGAVPNVLRAPDVIYEEPGESVSSSLGVPANTNSVSAENDAEKKDHTIKIDGKKVIVLRTTNRYVYLKRESRLYYSNSLKSDYLTTMHTGMGIYQTYVLEKGWSQVTINGNKYYVRRSNIVYSTGDIQRAEPVLAKDKETVAALQTMKKKLPKSVWKRFVALKYSVEVPELTVAEIYPGITTGAVYSDKAHRIFLDQDKIETMYYHEFGHFWDYSSGKTAAGKKLSSTAKFKKVWRLERKKASQKRTQKVTVKGVVKKETLDPLMNTIVRKNKEEYFARSFDLYCLNKKTMRKFLPRTYKYMASIVKA